MEKVKEFYNNFDKRLLKDFVSNNPRVVAALEFVIDYFKFKAPNSLLDIGCGIGWSSYEFSRIYQKSTIKGIDLSDKLISVAKDVFSAPNLSFSEKDLTESGHIANGKYDAIVMIDVFEHIPAASRQSFYQDLKTVLSNDFSILLTCPTKQHQHNLHLNNPEGLQPVDEDIDVDVLQDFARAVGGQLVHYTHRNIWNTNDYLHAVISNNIPYNTVGKSAPKMHLLSSKEKIRLLKGKGISIEEIGIIKQRALLKRVIKKILPF